jgi:hypothetical protein
MRCAIALSIGQIARSGVALGLALLATACGQQSTSASGVQGAVASAAVTAPKLMPTETFSCPLPTGTDIVSERRESVSAWSVELVECTYGPTHSDALVTTVYARQTSKDVQRLADGVVGSLIPLLGTKRIFACQDSGVMSDSGPFLVDLNSHVIRLPHHAGSPSRCEKVGTGEQVLMQYDNIEKSGSLFSVVRIYDGDGTVLADRKYSAAGQIYFSVGGKKFSVTVSEPAHPG